MRGRRTATLLAAGMLMVFSAAASAGLVTQNIYTGRVDLSIDAIGSNFTPVGSVQAHVPVGSTILQAYLYSAGTPFPWYADSPTTLGDYNSSGITLAGTPITNFDHLVGATATPRPDIGRFFTARADVTALVTALVSGAATDDFSWIVDEGRLNTRIDGEVLVIAYSNPSLPEGSVAILDGGQDTGGDTTIVNLSNPLGDPSAPGFVAQMSIADSFSCCNVQRSTINVNGNLLTQFAGNFDDGLVLEDGSLITAGGIGDTPQSAPSSYADDHELYDLRPFLAAGDMSFSLFTINPSSDDNIFFLGLSLTGEIGTINPTPEPGTLALMALAAVALAAARRRSSRA